MYASRGATSGTGGVPDGGYDGGSLTKRPRMIESNPYLTVTGGAATSSATDGYDSATSSKRPRSVDSNPYYSAAAAFYRPYSAGASAGGGTAALYSFPVVKLRGLPYDCDDLDIYRFFSGLDIVDCLYVNKHGRFTGEAFVVFASPVQSQYALQRDRQNMGRRYVEVFSCKKQDYYKAIADENSYGEFGVRERTPPPQFRPTKRQREESRPDERKNLEEMVFTEVLKLRGLPYSVRKSEIVDFFGDEFRVTEERVRIGCRPDGKASGEAYVEFESADVARRAMCRDKMMIGSRYVELFPSSMEEAGRVRSRARV